MGPGAEPDRYRCKILDANRRTLDDRGTVEAMCEDYQAGASVDVEHDDADRRAGRHITCPLLVLWAERGRLPRFYPDLLEVGGRGADVRDRGIDATHFLAEDRAEETAEQPPGLPRRQMTSLPAHIVPHRTAFDHVVRDSAP